MVMWQRLNIPKIQNYYLTNHYSFTFSEVLCNSIGFNHKGLTERQQRALPLTADREFVQNCLSSLLKLSFLYRLLKHPNLQPLDHNQNDEG